jgi:hypothetical protein
MTETCKYCDGKGNTWVVTYNGDINIDNFFPGGQPLEKGRTINRNVYAVLCNEYRKRKLFARIPKIAQDKIETGKKYIVEQCRVFREQIDRYDQNRDVHNLRDVDHDTGEKIGYLTNEQLLERYTNVLIAIELMEFAKLYIREDVEPELNRIYEKFLICNQCEAGKNRLANKKNVNAF